MKILSLFYRTHFFLFINEIYITRGFGVLGFWGFGDGLRREDEKQ